MKLLEITTSILFIVFNVNTVTFLDIKSNPDTSIHKMKKNKTTTRNNIKMKKSKYPEYKIEDKIVSYKEFQRFLDSLSLTEIKGTYICKLTTKGGHNWHEAKDKDGVIYICGNRVDNEKDLKYIHKK